MTGARIVGGNHTLFGEMDVKLADKQELKVGSTRSSPLNSWTSAGQYWWFYSISIALASPTQGASQQGASADICNQDGGDRPAIFVDVW
jgi:hypothetical protein